MAAGLESPHASSNLLSRGFRLPHLCAQGWRRPSGLPTKTTKPQQETEAPRSGPGQSCRQGLLPGGISSWAQPGREDHSSRLWACRPRRAGVGPQGSGGGRGSCQARVQHSPTLRQEAGLDGLTHTPLCRKQNLGMDSMAWRSSFWNGDPCSSLQKQQGHLTRSE